MQKRLYFTKCLRNKRLIPVIPTLKVDENRRNVYSNSVVTQNINASEKQHNL